jgi:hypothetical protein
MSQLTKSSPQFVKPASKWVIPAPKECGICGTVFHRAKHGESNLQFKSRKSCSEPCRVEMMLQRSIQRVFDKHGVSALLDKVCANESCDNVLKFDGKLPMKFVRRIACSKSCGCKISADLRRGQKRQLEKKRQPISYYWNKWSAKNKLVQAALAAGPTLRAGNLKIGEMK